MASKTLLSLKVLPANLKGRKDSPTGDGTDATDQPGLKEMTLKAIDILQARSNGQGWFMMSVIDSSPFMPSLAHWSIYKV